MRDLNGTLARSRQLLGLHVKEKRFLIPFDGDLRGEYSLCFQCFVHSFGLILEVLERSYRSLDLPRLVSNRSAFLDLLGP